MKNIEQSSSDRQVIIKHAGKNDFISFCEIIDPKYEVNWHHEIIGKKLQEAYEKLLKGIGSRIIIEQPPRYGKSEMATIKFPAWVLGKTPEWPVIVASYSADLAEDFGFKARDIMSQNDNYKALFKTRLREDTQAKKKWLTQQGGGYTATGVGGPITGKGFKIGIIDDPIKNREEANSETMRDKIWDWYRSTFYTRQDGVSIIIIILTRWHLDDLVGRLEEQENEMVRAGVKNYDEWEYITFPAIAEEDEEFRKKGEALWPTRFSIDQLRQIESSLGMYEFSSLYQQHPVPSENQEFRKEWFKYFEEDDLKNKNLEYFTTIDPAISEKSEANNSVVLTIAKERSRSSWYRVEESAGKMNPTQLIDAIFAHREKYRSKIFLESVAYQKSLKYFTIEEQKKRQVYFTVNELKGNLKTKKEIRIRGLIPLYQAGVIYHRRSDALYERELLEFPNGKLDDRIDCMASQLEAVAHTVPDDIETPQKKIITDPYAL